MTSRFTSTSPMITALRDQRFVEIMSICAMAVNTRRQFIAGAAVSSCGFADAVVRERAGVDALAALLREIRQNWPVPDGILLRPDRGEGGRVYCERPICRHRRLYSRWRGAHRAR